MSTTFTALPLASTIDATADYLAIDTTSVATTQRITRNTLLGITGSPVGTSDTQALTNKTIGITNTITLKDTLFTLQDDGDVTKQAKFQLSGITTGTTRTLTLPNASVTLASLTGTETFTNKTITSPAITGGSIDNTTITVDTISGHTTSTIVTVGGVQLNNGTIGTASAVTTASIADGAVTPAKLVTGTGSGWSWSSWSPTWTNLTVGNGTLTSRYVQTGKAVTCFLKFVLGSTSAVSGAVSFTLPVTAASQYSSNIHALGLGYSEDTGVLSYNIVPCIESSTTAGTLRTMKTDGTYGAVVAISGSVPWSWGTGDFFSTTFTYEAA